MNVRNTIKNILNNMGFYIDSDKDINLLEYGMDSISLIEFIVNIEQELGIVIPDEILTMESIFSLNGFITYIEALV